MQQKEHNDPFFAFIKLQNCTLQITNFLKQNMSASSPPKYKTSRRPGPQKKLKTSQRPHPQNTKQFRNPRPNYKVIKRKNYFGILAPNNYTKLFFNNITIRLLGKPNIIRFLHLLIPIFPIRHHPINVNKRSLMDVLGVGEEGDPWKTPKRRWNTTEMKIRARRALGNGGFWWRWRVEVKLWYGRWLKEMKEKVSHVCSQNNRRVEWSQHKHSIRNFKS